MKLIAKHISKAYADQAVLNDLSFEIESGKTLAVLGRSGCGKTTLLKILAGLEESEKGAVLLGEKDVTAISPNQRNMVYAYQEAMLFPHMTVFENIAFGLRIRKFNKNEIRNRVEAMLEEIGLANMGERRPHELSGGQAQRVAFGRALIIQPDVLLLDEPFGKLDVETRAHMQDFYKEVTHSRQITALFVTHDLKEALRLGDSLAYMENGSLTTFSDKKAFLHDPRTGAMAEKAFWENLPK
ncbi:MAG: ABC transporter ATP-binding protein [Bacteroidia bacterium]